jgi:hypothetical protein
MDHTEQVNGSIIDADATLFELGRRLQYFSQRQEKKLSQKWKKNEHPITAKGIEGKRATACGSHGLRKNFYL